MNVQYKLMNAQARRLGGFVGFGRTARTQARVRQSGECTWVWYSIVAAGPWALDTP